MSYCTDKKCGRYNFDCETCMESEFSKKNNNTEEEKILKDLTTPLDIY